MATLYTHAFVGLAGARLYADRPMPWAYWGLAAALPMIPDLDVFFTGTYRTALGHRGITHSLLFALALAMIAAAATFKIQRGTVPFLWPTMLRTVPATKIGTVPVSWWSLTALFFAIIASHGVLDAMTRGGENVPFFWPFGGRYGNWGPLRVSDIAFDWPDPRRSQAIRAELLWVWLPMSVVVGLVTWYRHTMHGKRPTESPDWLTAPQRTRRTRRRKAK